jgi:hypothetical protein
MREVRGAPGGDDPVGARRSGGVEPHRADAIPRDAGPFEDAVEGEDEGLDRHLGTFRDAARGLDHPVDEEARRGLEHGRVVLVAAVVEADHDPRLLGLH